MPREMLHGVGSSGPSALFALPIAFDNSDHRVHDPTHISGSQQICKRRIHVRRDSPHVGGDDRCAAGLRFQDRVVGSRIEHGQKEKRRPPVEVSEFIVAEACVKDHAVVAGDSDQLV